MRRTRLTLAIKAVAEQELETTPLLVITQTLAVAQTQVVHLLQETPILEAMLPQAQTPQQEEVTLLLMVALRMAR